MASALQLGSIVWAEVADPSGTRKLRPAIVVTPSERISDTSPLHVVAVTSRLSEPLPGDHVLLPWHPQGHPRTGLNRRCAAVCTWLVQIQPGDIRDIAGVTPGPVLVEILRKIAATQPP
jgi:mRNA interferase MazF